MKIFSDTASLEELLHATARLRPGVVVSLEFSGLAGRAPCPSGRENEEQVAPC